MVRCGGGIDVATTITRTRFRGVRVLTTPPHRVRRAAGNGGHAAEELSTCRDGGRR